MTPKFDMEVAEVLPDLVAYQHAGHIGTRPNNKWEDCIEMHYHRALSEYEKKYGKGITRRVQDSLGLQAIDACEELQKYSIADKEEWIRKNKHLIKSDKKTLRRMLDELDGPDAHKYAGSAKSAIKSKAKKN